MTELKYIDGIPKKHSPVRYHF